MKYNKERIREVRDRCNKATEGPWEWYGDGDSEWLGPKGDIPCWSDKVVLDDGSACGEYGAKITSDSANGQFIKHARQDLPDALDNIEELLAINAELVDALEEVRDLLSKINILLLIFGRNQWEAKKE